MKSDTTLFKTTSARLWALLIPIVLGIITIAVYWQVHDFPFIHFDDPMYITENQHVRQGVSLDSLIWAFHPGQTDVETYWHPLTWLSHMLDCQLFGLNAGAHHLINLLFHILNITLLFLTLHLMTGAIWKSAFVAALFALHPVNVDSVAWIAERKNLLSTTFWMLTLLAYIRYARKPGIFRYLTVFGTMTLGLLAKPMLVTLPFVLLLLDFWPLGRMNLGQASTYSSPDSGPVFHPNGPIQLIIEKIPLLGLSFAAIALSMTSLQVNYQLADGIAAVSMGLRIENAIVSYLTYLGKLIWPLHLAVFYPFPHSIPFWQTIGAALLLAGVSVFVLLKAKKFPWLLTGWFWYVGTLIPVIGLVQGGLWPAMADRWAYVPFIGIFISIAWGIPIFLSITTDPVFTPPRSAQHAYIPYDHPGDQRQTKSSPQPIFCTSAAMTSNTRLRQIALLALSILLICSLSVTTYVQIGSWKNDQTLFEHALEVTSENDVAHNNLGIALYHRGHMEEANYHYQRAIMINPNNVKAHNNLGNSLASQGRRLEAIQHYQRAIDIQPGSAKVHFNLANTLRDVNRIDQAISHYLQAIALQPDYEKAYINLGNLLQDQGRTDEALFYYNRAILINPNCLQARQKIANIQRNAGRGDALIKFYQKAIENRPNDASAHYNLANALKDSGQLTRAADSYRQAIDIAPDNEKARHNLATLLMQTGRLDEAIKEYSEVLKINPKHANSHYNLGIAYYKKGNMPAAVESFKTARRLNPNADHIQAALSRAMERAN